MGRLPRNYQVNTPYHITARTNNSEWFNGTFEEVWNIFSDYLFIFSKTYDVDIHAFVLMNNHFHLLCSFKQLNQGEFLNRFLTETSRALNYLSERKNHTFGKRNYSSKIESISHYLTVLKYIYNNPVRAKICNHPFEYKYSTLNTMLGLNYGILHTKPLTKYDDLTCVDLDKFEKWLTSGYSDKQIDKIRKALVKTNFQPTSRDGIPIDFGVHQIIL